MDLHDTHQWLRSTRVKAQTEEFLVTAQDQSLFTRNSQANILDNGLDPRCRSCNTSTQTIDHLISECYILAPNEYTHRHSRVGQYQKNTGNAGKSVTIMILKYLTNWVSMNHYLLSIPQK